METLLTSLADVFPAELPKSYHLHATPTTASCFSRTPCLRVTASTAFRSRRRLNSDVKLTNFSQQATLRSIAQSPFGAGVLFVEKHDKRLRICVDYRRLKAITVKDVYPTPRVDVSIDKMKGASYYFASF